MRRGFSTLEMLIAMAILAATLSAVMTVSFGNQSFLSHGAAHDQALQHAQSMLESREALMRQDFRFAENEPVTSDGIFQEGMAVEDWPADPYRAKRVTARVSWQGDDGIAQSVALETLVSDFSDPNSVDTCDPELSGAWASPRASQAAFAAGSLLPWIVPAGHSFSAMSTISSMDAYQGKLYVALSSKSAKANDSLFMFDLSNPAAPSYLGSIDNNASVIEGANAVLAAGPYLYVGNAHLSNFKTCSASANCSELQVFDVSKPSSMSNVSNFLIPTTSPAFVTGTSTGQALGNALYYRNGILYLGLTKTATGPEFNIVDVHDPKKPVWLGGYPVGASINQIYVKNGFAYLATDDKSRELIILDVSSSTNPQFASSFDPAGTAGYEVGKSLYLIGSTLFMGFSYATGSPELYALNVANPAVTPQVIGTHVVSSSVMGMYLRDNDLYALTSTAQQLQAFDASDTAAIGTTTARVALSGQGAALDCEGNYLYAASNAGAQGAITTIGPGN